MYNRIKSKPIKYKLNNYKLKLKRILMKKHQIKYYK